MSGRDSAFGVRHRFEHSLVVSLVRAAHPRQAVLTALGVAVAAALSGRPGNEVLLVLVTVLTGQVALGWHNDLVDRERDTRHGRRDKPLSRGSLEPGTLGFAVACAVLLVIPLSVANGLVAALTHGGLLLVAGLTNLGLLRWTPLSFLPWAASYGLWPAFVAYGGYGGGWAGVLGAGAPTIAVTLAAGLLGIGVHFACALPGLVADRQDRVRTLPLLVAVRIGTPRLLALTVSYLVLAGVALVVAGATLGLRK